MRLLLLSILTIFSFTAFAQSDDYAIILKVRGKVKYSHEGKTFSVKKGSKIPEGSVLLSKGKSFAILKMADETKLTLGPNSSIKITSLSEKGKPGIISLLKGQLRSKVKPDKVKKGNKLFIKANMAALGVRGTETIINYNQKTGSFTVGGLTGEVAIASLKNNINDKTADPVSNLKKVLSDKNPNLIKLPKKYFSAIKASESSFKVSKPQVMNNVQYYALLRNPEPKFKEQKKKSLQKIRPSGLPNLAPEKDDSIVSMSISPEVMSEVAIETKELEQKTPGSSESSSTPIAGAIVDFKTGVIINPSETDPVDPVTGQRTPSTNVGSISPDGTYNAPEGLVLNDDGKFEVDPEVASENTQVTTASDSTGDSRAPAQTETPEVALPTIPKIEEINVEMLDFNDGDAIEKQNTQVSLADGAESNSYEATTSGATTAPDATVANNTTVESNESFEDNGVNVESDCPNRKLCDNFNSVSPTTTDIITKTAVQFNIIIKK
jgi:hypothetical protein